MLPVSAPVQGGLLAARLDTLGKVGRASNKKLLEIRGLGPKSLPGIQAFLASWDQDFDAKGYLAPEFSAPARKV